MQAESDNNRIRVLVVDDSALMSRQISNILNADSGIEVVGRAKDGLEALDMVRELKPDVVTMDVEMPRMNGITALKHIMVRHSIPTVMISALTKEGARTTFDALKYGAVDVVAKPSRREDENLDAQKADIISKVRRAASVRTGRSPYIRFSTGMPKPPGPKDMADSSTRFIGVGAGTGGYYALLRIIPGLSVEFHDVLIGIIHVSARYIEPFVSYLDTHSSVPVKAIQDGEVPEKGTSYVCSAEQRVVLDAAQGRLRFRVQQVGAENGTSTGSVDRLFMSLGTVAGPRSTGVIMTGAGNDGAEGLYEIRKNGGTCVVQDINNCMDPSMPIAALEIGAVDQILQDFEMADFLMNQGLGPTSHAE